MQRGDVVAVADRTGGYPSFVQLLCDAVLKELTGGDLTITAAHVAAPGGGSCQGCSTTPATAAIMTLEAMSWKVAVASGGESLRYRRPTSAANP